MCIFVTLTWNSETRTKRGPCIRYIRFLWKIIDCSPKARRNLFVSACPWFGESPKKNSCHSFHKTESWCIATTSLDWWTSSIFNMTQASGGCLLTRQREVSRQSFYTTGISTRHCQWGIQCIWKKDTSIWTWFSTKSSTAITHGPYAEI